MKDNRMRQTRNKWNNRGPRQVSHKIVARNPMFGRYLGNLCIGSNPDQEPRVLSYRSTLLEDY